MGEKGRKISDQCLDDWWNGRVVYDKAVWRILDNRLPAWVAFSPATANELLWHVCQSQDIPEIEKRVRKSCFGKYVREIEFDFDRHDLVPPWFSTLMGAHNPFGGRVPLHLYPARLLEMSTLSAAVWLEPRRRPELRRVGVAAALDGQDQFTACLTTDLRPTRGNDGRVYPVFESFEILDI